MKKTFLLSMVMLLGFTGCHAEEASPVKKIAQSLSTVVALRPTDYRLVVLNIPLNVSIDQGGTVGGSFRASSPFQVTISVAVWGKQTAELLEILSSMRIEKTDERGDYRWGIEIVAAWDQKPMAVYLDENRNLAEINGIRYHLDAKLADWVKRYAAPVMISLQK